MVEVTEAVFSIQDGHRQGMLRVRVLDDDGSFTTQDIIEIRNCPLCGKRFMKGRCV